MFGGLGVGGGQGGVVLLFCSELGWVEVGDGWGVCWGEHCIGLLVGKIGNSPG